MSEAESTGVPSSESFFLNSLQKEAKLILAENGVGHVRQQPNCREQILGPTRRTFVPSLGPLASDLIYSLAALGIQEPI